MGGNFNMDEFAEKLLEKLTGKLNDVTLQSFIDEYQAFVEKNRAEKTLEGVKLVCKHLLKYFSPLKSVQTISLKDAERFLDSLKKDAPKGVHNYLRVLKSMFNKGKEWDYLRENPFVKVKMQKEQKEKPVYVTEEQLNEIVKYEEREVVRDLIIVGFYTGCRRGELINITWKDVKLNDNLLIIGNKNFVTKGRKQRVVPIHPKVKEILAKRYRAAAPPSPDNKTAPIIIKEGINKRYVFCKSNGFPFSNDYFSKRFKRACRKAKLDEEIHFHCLRHGAATKMILSGAPLPAVQKIMGHANIQTTMIYTHPDLESLRDAVNRL